MTNAPISEPKYLLERWSPIGILTIFSIVWVWYFLWPKNQATETPGQSPVIESLDEPIDPQKGESYTNKGVYHFLKGEKAEAGKWLRKAALAGDPKGTGAYGAGMIEGIFPPQVPGRHLHEGAEWLMKAANNGDPYAKFVMGKMLYLGAATQKDQPRGLSYIQDAAREGNKSALKFLDDLKNKGPSE